MRPPLWRGHEKQMHLSWEFIKRWFNELYGKLQSNDTFFSQNIIWNMYVDTNVIMFMNNLDRLLF